MRHRRHASQRAIVEGEVVKRMDAEKSRRFSFEFQGGRASRIVGEGTTPRKRERSWKLLEPSERPDFFEGGGGMDGKVK